MFVPSPIEAITTKRPAEFRERPMRRLGRKLVEYRLRCGLSGDAADVVS